MLDCIIERTNRYIDSMPKKERKKYGQFFMASVQTIELTCYENDDNILGLLRENLHTYQANSKKDIQINIITNNYITSQYLDFNHMLGGNPEPKKYDFVIGNPPYGIRCLIKKMSCRKQS